MTASATPNDPQELSRRIEDLTARLRADRASLSEYAAETSPLRGRVDQLELSLTGDRTLWSSPVFFAAWSVACAFAASLVLLKAIQDMVLDGFAATLGRQLFDTSGTSWAELLYISASLAAIGAVSAGAGLLRRGQGGLSRLYLCRVCLRCGLLLTGASVLLILFAELFWS